jgi:hypothetical protein
MPWTTIKNHVNPKKTIKLALRKPLKHTSKIMNIVLSKSLKQTAKKTIKIALKEPLKQTF